MKIRYSYVGAIIFAVTYIILITFDIPFLKTKLFYGTFDLNEWFGVPLISYCVWMVIWAVAGAISGYGFYKKNKWLSISPIIIFSIINIFSQLIFIVLLFFACRDGCSFW